MNKPFRSGAQDKTDDVLRRTGRRLLIDEHSRDGVWAGFC